METRLTKADETKELEKELDPEEIAFLLQGRVDDCCIS